MSEPSNRTEPNRHHLRAVESRRRELERDGSAVVVVWEHDWRRAFMLVNGRVVEAIPPFDVGETGKTEGAAP